MKQLKLLFVLITLFTAITGVSANRIRQNFDFDWQFRLGESGAFKEVQLPHDWSRELDF